MNKVKLANSTIPVDVDKVRAWQRSKNGLKASGLSLVTHDAPVYRIPQRKPLSKVSKKRARQNRERAAMADRRWPERREGTVMCDVPWCTDRADDLNEKTPRGRGGSIVDEENTHPVCRKHNQELALEPAWGYELGFLRHSWPGPDGGDAA